MSIIDEHIKCVGIMFLKYSVNLGVNISSLKWYIELIFHNSNVNHVEVPRRGIFQIIREQPFHIKNDFSDVQLQLNLEWEIPLLSRCSDDLTTHHYSNYFYRFNFLWDNNAELC